MTAPKIVVHWLENSRSQRILWLLEELNLPYEVREYKRSSKTMLAPPELKAIHALGKSPVVTFEEADGEIVTLAESEAICVYAIESYGKGKLQIAAGGSSRSARADYLYWTSSAEGTFMLPCIFSIVFAQMPKQSPFIVRPLVAAVSASVMHMYVRPKLKENFDFIEAALKDKKYFVGDELTGADIMMSFVAESLGPALGYEAYPNTLRWLESMRARPAFIAAEKRGGGLNLKMFTS